MPKVTVAIAQYNRTEKLRLVLQDMLNQTYKDFELLVCDDASTEDTAAVMAEFDDPRIRYVRNERNLGLYPNFNRCVELAGGQYIAVYHNHDRYAPEIVERSVRLLDSHPEVGFVHTGTVSRAPGSRHDTNYVQPWHLVSDGRWFAGHLVRRWDSPVHQPTVMARREMYAKAGLYDDETYGGCADSAVWVKMSLLADVGYIPLPLMRVEPRVITDRYGPFEWKTTLGMARAHELGVRLLYEKGDSAEFAGQLAGMKRRNDRYFLMLFSQLISKGRFDLLEGGLEAIREQCTPGAHRITQTLMASARWMRYPLLLAAKSYGVFVRGRNRLNSWRGWALTCRNSGMGVSHD